MLKKLVAISTSYQQKKKNNALRMDEPAILNNIDEILSANQKD